VVEPGFKYNLSDVQSAIGIPQLRNLDRFIRIQRSYAALYNELFGGMAEIELPPDRPDSGHSWHLYTLRLNLDSLQISRDEFIDRLQAKRIGASVHFIPIPLHSFFAPFAARPENFCPAALELFPRLVSLPLYPAMTESDIVHVAETTKDILRAARKKTYAVAAGPSWVG